MASGQELRPRKGKGGRWFIGPSGGGVSFDTREEAEAYIAKESSPSAPTSISRPFIAIAVIAIGAGLYFAFGGKEGAAKECGDETMAYVMSQKAAAQQLRSPGTAKFALMPEAKSVRTNTCKFSISSWVDAQNGFGATVRTRYTADMEYSPESKTWRALDVKFDQ